MSTLHSEAELLLCFRDIDRDQVELDAELRFPLEVDDVLAWAYGPRAYLLYCDRADRPPRGIVFHRNHGAAPDAAAMCEWCHAVRAHGGVKLMSVAADDRRRVGLYLCSDLSCVSNSRGVPSPDDVRESLDSTERTRRTLKRISEFAARRIF